MARQRDGKEAALAWIWGAPVKGRDSVQIWLRANNIAAGGFGGAYRRGGGGRHDGRQPAAAGAVCFAWRRPCGLVPRPLLAMWWREGCQNSPLVRLVEQATQVMPAWSSEEALSLEGQCGGGNAAFWRQSVNMNTELGSSWRR
ncbi:hypothetical protein E2562_031734 [Oryza meyeriana var. granulata]|uniref:Uncharacterized protein n=1 Tax=Oryza meyeriana var. granulata TaxID=110450 RepID=A0A6G1CTS3_9ORYZ|nr:hypothetical protein E2562_031734 [Oryza meyeriana var. granulata]